MPTAFSRYRPGIHNYQNSGQYPTNERPFFRHMQLNLIKHLQQFHKLLNFDYCYRLPSIFRMVANQLNRVILFLINALYQLLRWEQGQPAAALPLQNNQSHLMPFLYY